MLVISFPLIIAEVSGRLPCPEKSSQKQLCSSSTQPQLFFSTSALLSSDTATLSSQEVAIPLLTTPSFPEAALPSLTSTTSAFVNMSLYLLPCLPLSGSPSGCGYSPWGPGRTHDMWHEAHPSLQMPWRCRGDPNQGVQGKPLHWAWKRGVGADDLTVTGARVTSRATHARRSHGRNVENTEALGTELDTWMLHKQAGLGAILGNALKILENNLKEGE